MTTKRLFASGLLGLCLFPAPTSAQILTEISSVGGTVARDIEMIDGHVLVTDLAGLAVFDINAPEAPVTRVDGAYRYIERLGSHIWIGRDDAYEVYDVSDPASPVLVGPLAITPSEFGAYDAATQRYYGLDQQNGDYDLSIYDVSSIANPILLGQLADAIPLDPMSYYINLAGVGVSQDRFYASYGYTYGNPTHGWWRLRIFQASDPANVSLIDQMNLTVFTGQAFAANFDAAGDQLFAISTDGANLPEDSRLISYEVDDLAGGLQQDSFPEDLFFGPFLKGVDEIRYDPLGQTVRLWGGRNGRYVEFDVTDPAQLTLTCDVATTPDWADANDGVHYVTYDADVLDVYAPDCSGLHHTAQILHGYEPSGYERFGDLVVLGTRPATVMSLVNPSLPTLVHKFDAFGSAPNNYGALLPLSTDHLAQMNRVDAMLRIFDMTDPAQPSSSEFPVVGPLGFDYGVSGNTLAYVRYDVGVETSLQLVDLSDPSAPDFKGSYTASWADWNVNDTWDLAMYAGTAYLSVLDEIWVIDVSKLNAPKLKTTIPASTLGASADINLRVAHGLLFSSDTTDPRIWDLADPQNPVQLATLPLSGVPNQRIDDVEFVGDAAFFWYGTTLHVYDLSNPASPGSMGSLDPSTTELGSYNRALGVFDSYILAYFDWELRILLPAFATATLPMSEIGPILLRSSPNPSAGRTQISWSANLSGPGELRLYDVAGRLVQQWNLPELASQSLFWDGRDRGGAPVANGIYYAQLRAATQVASRRLVLMR